jgi:hypothetical protein
LGGIEAEKRKAKKFINLKNSVFSIFYDFFVVTGIGF